MSKIVIVAVFIFWIAVSFFYANTLVKKSQDASDYSQVLMQETPVNYTLTTALVAQHNTASDCWVTAGNNVYNVTSYIQVHPGGAAAIVPYCGADIAAAFASQGHSQDASNIMASYKIGVLGATVDNTAIDAVNNNTAGTGGGRGDDEEDEDEWDDD